MKVDARGLLVDEHGQKKHCPYNTGQNNIACGDWCAQFEIRPLAVAIGDSSNVAVVVDGLSRLKKARLHCTGREIILEE